MLTRSIKPHCPRDLNLLARSIVEESIGENLDGTPLDDPNEGKNSYAVALGRFGGAKGGKAREESLSPEKRKAIAKKAQRRGGNDKTSYFIQRRTEPPLLRLTHYRTLASFNGQVPEFGTHRQVDPPASCRRWRDSLSIF
jgi:hypothetical protein